MEAGGEEASAVTGREAAAGKAAAAGKEGKGGAKLSSAQRKALEALERRKAEQVAAEVVRAQSLASLRWSDCLQCLSSSLPLLADNPYLCILQPPFLYDYLDSLTETLANLSSHSDDLTVVRALLQSVYQSFIELGKFAKYQPSFYFDDAASLRRFIRLLEQVSHRQSDKALYPNILSLLTPTFSRTELYPLLHDLGLLRCLLAFTVNGWIPSPHTSSMLFAIVEEMTADESMRRHLQAEPGWERLCKLAWGREAGLSREQQQRGQQALQWGGGGPAGRLEGRTHTGGGRRGRGRGRGGGRHGGGAEGGRSADQLRHSRRHCSPAYCARQGWRAGGSQRSRRRACRLLLSGADRRGGHSVDVGQGSDRE